MSDKARILFEESTTVQPMAVIRAFLDDDKFWSGARFRGVLCDSDGNVVPWEADIIPEALSGYTLSGGVQFDNRPAISVRSFFELWQKTK